MGKDMRWAAMLKKEVTVVKTPSGTRVISSMALVGVKGTPVVMWAQVG